LYSWTINEGESDENDLLKRATREEEEEAGGDKTVHG